MSARENCFYCDKPILSDLVERDHAPIAQRHGGTDTVPACVPCHDLKDRLPLSAWDVPLMVRALRECGPLGRIYLAKAFNIARDNEGRTA